MNPFLFAITTYRQSGRLVLGEYTLDEQDEPTVFQREIPILITNTTVQRTFTPEFGYSEMWPIRVEPV